MTPQPVFSPFLNLYSLVGLYSTRGHCWPVSQRGTSGLTGLGVTVTVVVVMMLDRWRRDGDGGSYEDMYDPASRSDPHMGKENKVWIRMISLADIGWMNFSAYADYSTCSRCINFCRCHVGCIGLSCGSNRKDRRSLCSTPWSRSIRGDESVRRSF